MASQKSPWLFDVASLMVLLGENEETAFRSARDTYLETFVAAPIAGIQGYLKTYEGLPGTSPREYFSPYGRKWAPLRNLKLEHMIKHLKLLRDRKYTTCDIKIDGNQRKHLKRYDMYRRVWLIFNWMYFGGLVALWRFAPFGVLPRGTWVGITNIVVLVGWSVIVRTTELAVTKAREKGPKGKAPNRKADKSGNDAVIFMGQRNSALVIGGSRRAIKHWTTADRLDFNNKEGSGIQNLIRIGTILVLLLVFVTIPNGSTTDQLVFVLVNILGGVNLYFGRHINANCCYKELSAKKDESEIRYRTQIYGKLLRHFKNKNEVDSSWVKQMGLLPQTTLWDDWAIKVVEDNNNNKDPKELYDELEQVQKVNPPAALPAPNGT